MYDIFLALLLYYPSDLLFLSTDNYHLQYSILVAHTSLDSTGTLISINIKDFKLPVLAYWTKLGYKSCHVEEADNIKNLASYFATVIWLSKMERSLSPVIKSPAIRPLDIIVFIPGQLFLFTQ